MSTGAGAFLRPSLGRLRLHVRRPRPRWLIGLVLVGAALAAGGWLLLRSSPLVSVERVTITGVAGPDAGSIDLALRRAAEGMSTLDVQTSRLRRAVAGFSDVRGLSVATRFPHGLVIHVVQLLPVGLVAVAGRRVAVSADGRLLPALVPHTPLPLISLAVAPSGPRLTRAGALAAVHLLGAAPYRLLSRCGSVSWQGEHGLTVALRNGPRLYFGQATQLAAKWRAVVAVLASPSSAGAAYIDVTDPAHPAAGVGAAAYAAAGGTTGASSSLGGGLSGGIPGGAAGGAGVTPGGGASAGGVTPGGAASAAPGTTGSAGG